MKEIDPNEAIDFIFKNAALFAKAKGQLAELENYRHSLKAIKMSQTDETSLGAQEREAYRSPEYQELCKAIGLATEEAEKLRWSLIAAQLRVEVWKTQQYNERTIERIAR